MGESELLFPPHDALPDDVFVLIMASLVHLDACPKPLLRLLLTARQLLNQTVVVPFLWDYVGYLSRMHTHFSNKVDYEYDRLADEPIHQHHRSGQ